MGGIRCAPETSIILAPKRFRAFLEKVRIPCIENRSFYELVASTNAGDLAFSKSRSPKGLGEGEHRGKPSLSTGGVDALHPAGRPFHAAGKSDETRGPCDRLCKEMTMVSWFIKFLYFDVGFQLRYWFWKILVGSSGGRMGKGVKIYGGARIVGNGPGAISIGNDVRILKGATLSTTSTGKMIIGDRVHIGEGTIIFSGLSIKIGNDVIIGPHNVIVDSDHRYEDLSRPMNQQPLSFKEVSIEDDVWISSNCVITKGVTLCKGSVIGAGAVVKKDIPPYSVAVGVPARVIKKRGSSSNG